jgi:uncharacterized membrane protein (UPF0127 family)
VAYRVAVRASAFLGLLVGTVVLVAPSGSASSATANLRLDGIPFHPELALTSGQQQRGLMFRKKAPADGMLFVFSQATSGGFWMKNTLVPLTIVYFDTAGRRVRRMSMTPCRKDPCRVYDPERQYRYALELPATDQRPARRLGPAAELQRLVRAAG